MRATRGTGRAISCGSTPRACRRTCSACAAACATSTISSTSSERLRLADPATATLAAPATATALGAAAPGAPAAAAAADDARWYKDAIIYQLHVKAFHDSNADGVGDFRGLTEKLDYIKDLGVNTIWLLPFYPSPLRDDGYDVADYRNVHPLYGTRADFQHFVREAHRRELRVITELIVNHTSDQHPWFQAARRAPKGSPKRD